jgi:hypothetical protein
MVYSPPAIFVGPGFSSVRSIFSSMAWF